MARLPSRHRHLAILSAAIVAGAFLWGGRAARALVRPYDLDGLSRRSAHVLTGEVVDMTSYRAPFHDLGEVTFTDVTIRVERSLKGRVADATVTVRVLGGRIGRRVQVCPDSARYEVGEMVLVFLREHDGALWNCGWHQGKYRLEDDGATVAGGPGLPIARRVALRDVEERVARAIEPSSSGSAPVRTEAMR